MSFASALQSRILGASDVDATPSGSTSPAPSNQYQDQFFAVSNTDGIYDIGGKKFRIVEPGNQVQGIIDSVFGGTDGGVIPNNSGYPAIQILGDDGKWTDFNLIGGDNRGLHAAAALQDPRFAQWLSQDDPSTQADNLVRGVWARDPAEALGLYGQQAARKPGGIDKTPDADWFTDEKYWPNIYGSAATGADKSLLNDTQAVAQQLGLVNQDTANASARWSRDMSPKAQHDRNDPDAWYEGPVAKAALMVAAAYFGAPYLASAGNAAAGAVGLEAGSFGATLVSGAAQGAIVGGAGAMVSGGDVGQGILRGAISGGVGAGVTSGVADSGMLSSLSPTTQNVVSGAIGKAAGGAAGALATGSTGSEALTSGAISGISSGVGGVVGNQFGTGGSFASTLTGTMLRNMTNNQSPTTNAATSTADAFTGGTPTTTKPQEGSVNVRDLSWGWMTQGAKK